MCRDNRQMQNWAGEGENPKIEIQNPKQRHPEFG